MVKAVGLFLLVILALAIFGRFRVRRRSAGTARRCPSCGRHLIGRGPCPCGGSGRG